MVIELKDFVFFIENHKDETKYGLSIEFHPIKPSLTPAPKAGLQFLLLGPCQS